MKRNLWRQTADQVIEEQILEQEAWIEATGDVTDPGDLGTLVTIVEALASGDEGFAAEMVLILATSLREGGAVEAKEAFVE